MGGVGDEVEAVEDEEGVGGWRGICGRREGSGGGSGGGRGRVRTLEQGPRLLWDMIPVRYIDYGVLDVEPEAEVGLVGRAGLQPAVVHCFASALTWIGNEDEGDISRGGRGT